ncbi:YfhO family protein [bacterium]|nr:YfhO family protein [bacterium]
MKKFMPHLIAIGIFIILSSIYFSPVFEGKVLSAHDVDTWKGMSKEVQDFRKETGSEALWTKRMFSGMPAYQISTRSNGNLIQHVDKIFQLGLPKPMNLLFMYLLGFYILILSLKIDYKLAIVGSMGFAFSSYFIIIIQAGHMTKAHAIAYLPLIIASVLYTFNNKKWFLGAVFTSLFVALQLYSNHYQITYYTIIILFFIGIVQFVKQLKDKSLSEFFQKTGVLLLAALLAGATNYTRLSTTLEYGPETQRGKSELENIEGTEKNDGLGLKYATQWSYGISETMTFLIPNFMGGSTGKSVLNDTDGELNKDSETYKYLRTLRNQKRQQKLQRQTSTYWGEQPGTSPTYVGAVIVFLFVLGVMYVKSSYRVWILLTTILSIMLGWGSNFMGLTEFFFNYIPAYNKFRAVTMAMIIAEFGIALLAILALNKFLNSKDINLKESSSTISLNFSKEYALKVSFYFLGGITLIFAIYPSIFVDFLSSKDYLNNNTDFIKRLASDRESILKSDAWRSFVFILFSAGTLWMFIKNKLNKQYVVIIFGVLILSDLWSVDKRYLNETHFLLDNNTIFRPTQADKEIIKKNTNQSRVFNFNNPFNESRTSYFHNSIGGYHAAKLLRYQELIDKQLTKNNTSVLSMLNCGWMITPQGKAIPSSTQGINPLGYAWFVSNVKNVNNANEEMESLDSFDPSTTAIVDNRYSENLKKFTKDNTATILLDLKSYQPNHLTYNLSNINSDQLVVFSEIYYSKGWNSYIDNKIVPHFRSNYVLRSMMVPKGTTKIEFKFEPSSYSNGENIAYVSSILLLILIGWVSYKELK